MCVYRSSGTILKLVETSNQCQKNGAKIIKMHNIFFSKHGINGRFILSASDQNPNSNLSLTVCFDLRFEKKRGQTASSLLKSHTTTSSKHQLYQFAFSFLSPTDEMKWARERTLFSKIPTVPICSIGPSLWQCW